MRKGWFFRYQLLNRLAVCRCFGQMHWPSTFAMQATACLTRMLARQLKAGTYLENHPCSFVDRTGVVCSGGVVWY